jgi:hypothetical protein
LLWWIFVELTWTLHGSWILKGRASLVHQVQSAPQKKDLLNVRRWEQIYAQLLADPQGQSLMITNDSECI